ncbi:SLBB domain-containing protein [Undibacterium sp. RuTC16W]|uniref:SLBB domain-containing protein n=1 Tax=Undibacterium sp. RuTC16W TaxID=3413048 RepID=UPI003BF0FA70
MLLSCLCLPIFAQTAIDVQPKVPSNSPLQATLQGQLQLKLVDRIAPENVTLAVKDNPPAANLDSTQISDNPTSAREVIGEGDQLLVTVFGQPDLTSDVTVGESGVITLPLVGVIDTKGKTPAEVAVLFANRLEQGQYVRSPKVAIKVLQQLSRTFSVLGEVQRPGRYPLPNQLTLLDALSLAGGLNNRADKGISLMRRGKGQAEAETVDYIPLRIDPQTTQTPDKLNQKILPNDVLFVSSQKTFYVYGEVRKPGNYPIEEELTVMRVLSIGGGVTERGSTRRMTIYRKTEDGGTKEIPAKITDQVLPGDVLFINERLF